MSFTIYTFCKAPSMSIALQILIVRYLPISNHFPTPNARTFVRSTSYFLLFNISLIFGFYSILFYKISISNSMHYTLHTSNEEILIFFISYGTAIIFILGNCSCILDWAWLSKTVPGTKRFCIVNICWCSRCYIFSVFKQYLHSHFMKTKF